MFFETFEHWGIGVSWTLVKIGYNFAEYSFSIKQNELVEYAVRMLNGNKSNNKLTELICSPDSKDEVNRILDGLIKCEKASAQEEQRKWNLYVVWKAINELSFPPTQEELFCLGDIWGYLGRPKNYPWDVRECEYIKCSDYNAMINAHLEWINNELDTLKA